MELWEALSSEFETDKASKTLKGAPMTPADLLTLRGELHMSQAGLAGKLGVHITTISRWERGVRKIPIPIARFILSLRPVVAVVAETPPAADSPDDRESRHPG